MSKITIIVNDSEDSAGTTVVPECPDKKSFRLKDGQIQLWDQELADADPSKPWRVLECVGGQLGVSSAISN